MMKETVISEARPRTLRWRHLGLRVAGAGLLLATGAIHLDLYLTGYRSIPTIGWLFLLQVITAFALGAVVLVSGSRLAAAAGAAFLLATLGGYLLSVWVGLFGFKEVRTTAGIVAGVIEVTGFVALAALTLSPVPAPQSPATARSHPGDRLLALLRPGAWTTAAVAGLAIAGFALLGAAAATASSPATTASGGGLRTTTIGGATVLTNAKGFTLYWFAPDTPTTSRCYGSCAAYWPPVLGSPTADPGVSGNLGTITRTDGRKQATYNGHPLYTYIGDSAPGQARGNNLNLNGGVWHEVIVSGS
jgi:predicted lipoprotein with Yx(FWY)xxD motif